MTLIAEVCPLAPAITAALESALARPWSADDARRAVAHARTFDWAQTARQVLAVYRAALSSRRDEGCGQRRPGGFPR